MQVQLYSQPLVHLLGLGIERRQKLRGGGVLPLAEAYAIGHRVADVKEDTLDIIVSEALLEAEWPAVIMLGGERSHHSRS